MSTGDNERVNSGVPAAPADSFGPRGSPPSPRALPLSANVTPWPPASRLGRELPGTPSTFPTAASAQQQPKLLDRLRGALRARHYSPRTEQTYCVRDGKGFKDRITMLPEAVKRPLADHLEDVKRIHKDVKTTMVYTHVLNRGGRGVRSPVDSLGAPPTAGVIDGNRITPQ